MEKLFEFIEHIGKWRVLVQTRDIRDGAVTTAKLDDNAVTTSKLADESVTPEKLSGKVTEEVVTPVVNEALGPLMEISVKHVFLTEEEYQALVEADEVEPDVLYFTTENS